MNAKELYENLIQLYKEYDEMMHKLTHDPDMTEEKFEETVNRMNDLAVKDVRYQLSLVTVK